MSGSRIARVRSHRGLLAATTTLALSGGIAWAGVAGAAEQADTTITAGVDRWDKPSIQIEPGDTVTWNMGAQAPHNLKATNDPPQDPAWNDFRKPTDADFDMAPADATYEYTFEEEGEYTFVCKLHAGTMTGTVVVSTDPVEPTPDPPEDPEPTTDPSPQPTTSPTPQPRPVDDHTSTPAPTGGTDVVKPRIAGVRVKALRRGARVRFRLSEPASVTITIKRRGKVYRTARVHAPAGTRRVTVRGKLLKRGRYVVQLRARDAMGNRSSLAKKSLRRGR
jgi:plastocyanin